MVIDAKEQRKAIDSIAKWLSSEHITHIEVYTAL